MSKYHIFLSRILGHVWSEGDLQKGRVGRKWWQPTGKRQSTIYYTERIEQFSFRHLSQILPSSNPFQPPGPSSGPFSALLSSSAPSQPLSSSSLPSGKLAPALPGGPPRCQPGPQLQLQTGHVCSRTGSCFFQDHSLGILGPGQGFQPWSQCIGPGARRGPYCTLARLPEPSTEASPAPVASAGEALSAPLQSILVKIVQGQAVLS